VKVVADKLGDWNGAKKPSIAIADLDEKRGQQPLSTMLVMQRTRAYCSRCWIRLGPLWSSRSLLSCPSRSTTLSSCSNFRLSLARVAKYVAATPVRPGRDAAAAALDTAVKCATDVTGFDREDVGRLKSVRISDGGEFFEPTPGEGVAFVSAEVPREVSLYRFRVAREPVGEIKPESWHDSDCVPKTSAARVRLV
jgi:hypothetical protein